MFVGFIAVVVILLIIVAIMSTGTLTGGDESKYIAEAKKVNILVSNIKAESNFYYVGHNQSFIGIDMSYFDDVGFDKALMQTDGLLAAEWKGISSDIAAGTTTMCLGGSAGCDMRIVVTGDTSGGNDANLLIIKLIGIDKVNNTTGAVGADTIIDNVPAVFTKVLEKELSNDQEWIGA